MTNKKLEGLNERNGTEVGKLHIQKKNLHPFIDVMWTLVIIWHALGVRVSKPSFTRGFLGMVARRGRMECHLFFLSILVRVVVFRWMFFRSLDDRRTI